MTASRSAAATIRPCSFTTTAMGGRLAIHFDAGERSQAEAERAAGLAFGRIDRWAGRLTRHSDGSALSVLNRHPGEEVEIGPTLAAALEAGRQANEYSEGLTDISLLDARLAAEGMPVASQARYASRAFNWSLAPGPGRRTLVRRPAGLRFDLGGVGKGWIADRALRLLADWPGLVVDADGDLAVRASAGGTWEIGVDDPRSPDTSLAILRLTADGHMPSRWGVATSGTTIHRWNVAGRDRHHIIDPRTGRPAVTDVIQATVVAGSALRAEALAKAAVISGSVAGLALLERARVVGAVVLTERGETLALPQTLSLLAA